MFRGDFRAFFMRIDSVDFAGAVAGLGQAQPETIAGLSQVAFCGRSNVGKSSLINRLLGRTRTPIARVSQSPGKTQEINFYRVAADSGEFCLVDLPGYGFAKVPESVRSRWRPLIRSFLTGSEQLRGVIQLIDMRHGPTRDDLDSVEQLADLGIPVLFALTKADKLKSGDKRDAAFRDIVATLQVEPEQVIPCSAHNGAGIESLLDALGGILQSDV